MSVLRPQTGVASRCRGPPPAARQARAPVASDRNLATRAGRTVRGAEAERGRPAGGSARLNAPRRRRGGGLGRAARAPPGAALSRTN